MKRCLIILLSALLLTFSAFAEDLDEQELALTEDDYTAESAHGDISEAPDEIYVQSDVEDGTWERVIDAGWRPAFVHQLLEIAAAEIGYTEGRNNFSKYGEWSGDPNAAWCAEFICWCVDQVDQQYGTELLTLTYPKYSGQNTGRDWFLKHGRFVYRKAMVPGWGHQWEKASNHNLEKNEFIPRPGDLVFFSYNEAGDTEHVALVEYCAYDSEGNVIIHVIEGNNPSKVQRASYRLSNSQVLGFGLCEDVVDTTMRSGNRGQKVLELQKALNRIGILEERHLTGGYGGNTKRAVMDFQEHFMQDKAVTGIADRETQQAIEQKINQITFDDPESWLVAD